MPVDFLFQILVLPFVVSPELEVSFWEYNRFLQPDEDGPPALIPPSIIKSQASRLTVILPWDRITVEDQDPDEAQAEDDSEDTEPVGDKRKAWVTIGLMCVHNHYTCHS